VALDTCVYPTFDWDAFAIWQLKSKLLATEALTPRPAYFTDVSRSFSHLRYPILMPMICAGEHVMAGRLDDELEKSPLILLYLGMGAVVYSAIKVRRGKLAAITATTLLMCTPFMMGAAGNGTADVPLAAFYAGTLVSLLNWQQDRRACDLALCALLSICMAWTKQEGLYLAAINAAAVFGIAPRRPKAWIGFAAALGLAYLPWHIFAHPLPRTDENYTGHLHIGEIVAHLPRVRPVVHGFLVRAFYWDDWCVFWFALPAVALLERARLRRAPVALLWFLLLMHCLLNITPFVLVTNWILYQLMAVTQNRLMLHAAPAAALIIGLQWPRVRREPIKLPEPGIPRPQ
jgi:4-amino-4-deoxy-L-arabinose transferase-like glycosyltransferase